METTTGYSRMKPLERGVASVGLVLAGVAIAVTGVSYIANSPFPVRALVWLIGVAFVAVGLLTIVWPATLRRTGEAPRGGLRTFFLASIPLAFIVSSQVCGIGLQACNVTCHLTNAVLIVLAIIAAVLLARGWSVGWLLIPVVIIALIPHCVCLAPINTLWHSFLCGAAPTCEMIPLTITLFAVAGMRGSLPRSNAFLIVLLFVVMVFIIVGGLLWGFPWRGCVGHPGVAA
ncbi:MAG: hypothetical protein JSU81_02955 [Candidatus Coatesbacteria bacterium]|nr:MAG: hypothetical protein JSU81_02955 [Candidatus Coatesbacteria bacterium]